MEQNKSESGTDQVSVDSIGTEHSESGTDQVSVDSIGTGLN